MISSKRTRSLKKVEARNNRRHLIIGRYIYPFSSSRARTATEVVFSSIEQFSLLQSFFRLPRCFVSPSTSHALWVTSGIEKIDTYRGFFERNAQRTASLPRNGNTRFNRRSCKRGGSFVFSPPLLDIHRPARCLEPITTTMTRYIYPPCPSPTGKGTDCTYSFGFPHIHYSLQGRDANIYGCNNYIGPILPLLRPHTHRPGHIPSHIHPPETE